MSQTKWTEKLRDCQKKKEKDLRRNMMKNNTKEI